MASQSEIHENLVLFLPFLLGIDPPPTRPDPPQNSTDPDHNSANQPDPQTQTERILLLNPFIQRAVMVGGSALFPGDQEKQGRPPATKEAIEAMPVVEFGESEESGECAICLEEFGGGVVKETPCKHRFHGECVERWMVIHGSCPVCRFEMECDQRKSDGDGDGGGRRVLVTFNFGGGGDRRNPDRSSSGDDHHQTHTSTTGGSDIGS